jgi:hypothetical protein
LKPKGTRSPPKRSATDNLNVVVLSQKLSAKSVQAVRALLSQHYGRLNPLHRSVLKYDIFDA